MAPQVSATELRSLIRRVARAWTKTAFSMDEYARLSFLEGVTGETPGTLVRMGRRGFKTLQERFPDLDPHWTTSQDTGLYRLILGFVAKMLQSAGVTGTGAEEVLQELNMNAGTAAGSSYRRVFYTAGAALRKHGHEEKITSGEIRPLSSWIVGTLRKWVAQKALNVIKSIKEVKEKSHSTQVEMGPQTSFSNPFDSMGTQPLSEEEKMRLLTMAMRSNDAVGNATRRIIDQGVEKYFPKSDAAIVQSFMRKISDPQWSSPPASFKQRSDDDRPLAEAWFSAASKRIGGEIMQELGVSRQRISNALGGGASNVIKFMRTLGKNPAILKLVEDFAEEIEYLEAGPGLNITAAKRAALDLSHLSVDDLEYLERYLNPHLTDSGLPIFDLIERGFSQTTQQRWQNARGQLEGRWLEKQNPAFEKMVAAQWGKLTKRLKDDWQLKPQDLGLGAPAVDWPSDLYKMEGDLKRARAFVENARRQVSWKAS